MSNSLFFHGGNIHRIKRQKLNPVIDFSANINPLGLPEKVKEFFREGVDDILHYPDPDAAELTFSIARNWGIDEKNILVGNGSVDLIYLILNTFRPGRVIIPQPTFSEYERAAVSIKSKIDFIELREEEGFSLGGSRPEQGDMVFICNPNNPTGNLLLTDGQEIKRIPGEFLVVDEAFMDFLPEGRDLSLIGKRDRGKRIMVLRSFTKIFSMPGLRGGYLVAHRDIIEKLKESQPPWAMNGLSQSICKMMLDDGNYLQETHCLIDSEREFLRKCIGNIKGLTVYPSRANFLLIRIRLEGINSSILVEELLKKGVLIRDCSNFRGLDNQYFRIAVRSRTENMKLVEAFKEIFYQRGQGDSKREER